MSMAKSDYLENKILDHVLRNTAYSSPATVYAALFTNNPGETGSGTEVTGGSYARQSVSFAAASGGSIANDGTISFSDLPTTTVTHIAIFDASSGGNLLYYGELESSVIVNSGSAVNIAAGELVVSES